MVEIINGYVTSQNTKCYISPQHIDN